MSCNKSKNERINNQLTKVIKTRLKTQPLRITKFNQNIK